jgi:hypothetical protein
LHYSTYPFEAFDPASEIGFSGGLVIIDFCDFYVPFEILLSLAPGKLSSFIMDTSCRHYVAEALPIVAPALNIVTAFSLPYFLIK